MSKHISLSIEEMKKIVVNFWRKHKVIIKTTLVLTCFVFSTGFTSAYPELDPLINLLKFFIDLIKYCSGALGSIIATISGWNVITNNNGQGIKMAKSTLSRTLIGLTIVFFGSAMASFLVDKLAKILLCS